MTNNIQQQYGTIKISSKNKTYTPQFKFDRSIDSLKNNNVAEVARRYNISVKLIYAWRNQFIERGSKIFETSPDQVVNELKTKISRLEQMLGKKEVELNLLKNFSDFYSSQNTS